MALAISMIKEDEAMQALNYGAAAGELPLRDLIFAEDLWLLICSDKQLTPKEMAWMLQHSLFDSFSAACQKAYASGMPMKQIYENGLEKLDELSADSLKELTLNGLQEAISDEELCYKQRADLLQDEKMQEEADARWIDKKLAMALIKSEEQKKKAAA